MAAVSCGGSGTAAPSSVEKSCSVSTASVLLNAGDILRMKFTVPASATADILSYEVDYLPNPLIPSPSVSCQLFTGNTLLGSGSVQWPLSEYCGCGEASWRAAD